MERQNVNENNELTVKLLTAFLTGMLIGILASLVRLCLMSAVEKNAAEKLSEDDDQLDDIFDDDDSLPEWEDETGAYSF